MLHVRDMLPAVPEEVDELVLETEETSEPVYEREPGTGLLIATGMTATYRRSRYVKTGKRVLTGSRKQVDLTCADCGASLVPAPDDRPFYYLVCGRLHLRDPEQRRPEDGRWLPKFDAKGALVWAVVPSEEPYPDCVLECGGGKP